MSFPFRKHIPYLRLLLTEPGQIEEIGSGIIQSNTVSKVCQLLPWRNILETQIKSISFGTVGNSGGKNVNLFCFLLDG